MGIEILWLVGGLEHFLFFHILGIIIPTDKLIYFRGVGLNHQPDGHGVFFGHQWPAAPWRKLYPHGFGHHERPHIPTTFEKIDK